MQMSSLNVAEWSVEQVADWLAGLGPTVAAYAPALRARGLDGAKLLTLRCDDLEYLGMHVIGHQELLLEAVEHLRNFQYEWSRECVQQLALRVSVVARSLAGALRAGAGAGAGAGAAPAPRAQDARLHTQALADVARTVHAVKPLVCWLDRWPLCSSGGAAAALAERKAALLQLSLEAATCAQRERFAEQPAREVAAAAASAAAAADYIIQEVSDPMILAPASLESVTLRQGGRALGFDVLPSFCGHHQLADIRFGSPAHASGAVHQGDEIVQVGSQCVIGWSGEAVLKLCEAAGAELPLRLRRRAARAPRPACTRNNMVRLSPRPLQLAAPLLASPVAARPAPAPEPASSSDESEPLSPPASPTRLDHTRLYGPPPRGPLRRRHSVSGAPRRAHSAVLQFWQELRQHQWGTTDGAAAPEPDDVALYARDKAVSCSTGLELSPRPRTCLGVVTAPPPSTPAPPAHPAVPAPAPAHAASPRPDERGRLDKSHSTPAYDFGGVRIDEPLGEPLGALPIPESPTTPTDSQLAHPFAVDKADRILDFKKSSSQIGEAILQQRVRRNTDERQSTDPGPGVEGAGRDETTTERILETINIAMMEHRRRSAVERSVASPVNVDPAGRDDETLSSPEYRSSTPRYVRARAPEPPPRPAAAGPAAPVPGPFPVLRAVSRAEERPEPPSPLKPTRLDAAQISVPLRHITQHDMLVLPAERRELPPINCEPAPAPAPPPPSLRRRDTNASATSITTSTNSGDIVMGAQAGEGRARARSPPGAVRGMFPSSKARSLKKKSSILAKRRAVPARALAARGAAGAVWQRVRARAAAAPRWARRHLLLTHNLLYAYRTPECSKADCMIYLEGFTVSAAGEVKSRAHAFKVYHSNKTFYFASDSRDAMLAWIQLIHRATLLPALTAHQMDESKQYSETEYSDTESDTDSPQRERARDREKEKDKEKSKFGSLRKLAARARSPDPAGPAAPAAPAAPPAAASLDRKYLRFFSRNKHKDEHKVAKPANKSVGVPVPTEHYRSYRRVASPPAQPLPPTQPLHYIHASNPNLLELDTSDLVTKPALQPRPKPKQENLTGFVTLEQFMLKKQAEERRQVYSNRVLMGVEHRRTLQNRLDNIVPDVIYGEVCSGTVAPPPAGAESPPATAPRRSPRPHRDSNKPISVKGKDGYEKIVYPDETSAGSDEAGCEGGGGGGERRREPPPPPAHERWRDSLRRNDKVHSAREPEPSPALKAAAPCHPHHAVDSWNGGASPATVGGASASTEPPGPGVSRLRLMFAARAHRDSSAQPAPPPRAETPAPRPWRGTSGTSGTSHGTPRGPGAAGAGAQYPHLQCPPTFQPETYSLAPRRHYHADH